VSNATCYNMFSLCHLKINVELSKVLEYVSKKVLLSLSLPLFLSLMFAASANGRWSCLDQGRRRN